LFDEVDAGIGGITLNQVGDRIRSLADRQQVLLISHWPQLASLADQHFQVSKEVVSGETYTQCQLLSDQEIAQELARMAGGGEKGKIVAEQLVGRQQ
jgi:DNA repair protein RecN (Recombination protein N)